MFLVGVACAFKIMLVVKGNINTLRNGSQAVVFTDLMYMAIQMGWKVQLLKNAIE